MQVGSGVTLFSGHCIHSPGLDLAVPPPTHTHVCVFVSVIDSVYVCSDCVCLCTSVCE